MGKSVRCGIVPMVLAAFAALLQWYIIKCNPSVLSELFRVIEKFPTDVFTAAFILFWPAIAFVALMILGVKNYFSPHPLIKSREVIVYKTCTLVNINGDGIKGIFPRAICALILAALFTMTALYISDLFLQAKGDYAFARELGKAVLICVTCFFAAFSFVLCNVEAPAQSFGTSLISYGLYNLLCSTVSEAPTYVFRDTASPIRSTTLTSVILAILFISIGAKLFTKGYAIFANISTKLGFHIACALSILLILAPHLPNFDILFLRDILKSTIPSLIIPVTLFVYPHIVISPITKLEAQYKKFLEEEYGILPDGKQKNPRIDYYNFT